MQPKDGIHGTGVKTDNVHGTRPASSSGAASRDPVPASGELRLHGGSSGQEDLARLDRRLRALRRKLSGSAWAQRAAQVPPPAAR